MHSVFKFSTNIEKMQEGGKMEKNYISEIEDTHFFVKIASKIYGVCINIKDLDRAEEIINYFKETRKEQIEAWKKEWQLEGSVS